MLLQCLILPSNYSVRDVDRPPRLPQVRGRLIAPPSGGVVCWSALAKGWSPLRPATYGSWDDSVARLRWLSLSPAGRLAVGHEDGARLL